MRIIAGTARSLPLKTPEGLHTRPTSDKIKETLFNMLQNDIPGSRFLDLFAGSGQIGVEALSRGASEAVFVDNDKKAVACIQANLEFTKFDNYAQVCNRDALGALYQLEGSTPFDIVFMDPPYDQSFEQQILTYLSGSPLINEDSIVIVEASLQTDFDYVDELGFRISKFKKYKTNMHVFLQLKAKEE